MPSKPKPKPRDATRKLAEQIARDVFTCFKGTPNPVHCDQIWFYVGEQRQSGWSEKPMADAIEDILREELAK